MRARSRPLLIVNELSSDSQFLDDHVILADVAALEIIEQFSPARDQLKQASSRIVIFLVNFEMLSQLVDALREQSDLHLRRTRVRPVRFVICNYLFFYFFNR